MTYEVVFDVSERLPQLAVGVVAAGVLAVVIVVGIVDTDVLLRWWRMVLVDAQRFCNRVRTILGGPFDTGAQVRLSIIGDQIVRIEVAAPT